MSLTYDESNARITDVCTGRTIDRVYRKGKELIIVFTDSVELTLQADVNGDIHYKNHEIRIYLEGVGLGAVQGNLGG